MNVLVTGANGFIGGTMLAAARTAGYTVGEPADLLVFANGRAPRAEGSRLDEQITAHVEPILGILRHVQLADGALIVLLSSVAVRKGSHDPAYAAAKGAVEALVPTLALKYPKQRIVALSLGLVEGSLVERAMAPEHAQRHRNRMFSGRLVNVDEVAAFILALAKCSSIHNTVIALDGGYRL